MSRVVPIYVAIDAIAKPVVSLDMDEVFTIFVGIGIQENAPTCQVIGERITRSP
jgi:hypothetical protein